jgi:hypothetical protein
MRWFGPDSRWREQDSNPRSLALLCGGHQGIRGHGGHRRRRGRSSRLPRSQSCKREQSFSRSNRTSVARGELISGVMVGPTSERLLSSAAMIIDQCRSIGGDWLGQCHPAERFTGRLAYQARRNRIGLGCKPLRRHRHFRGGPAAGGPAYSRIAIQFGEEPLIECLGRPVVFRIFEGDRAGLEDYRAQFSRLC